MSLLLQNVKLVNGEVKHIFVTNGEIELISDTVKKQATMSLDLKGKIYVSSGWIDMHTHAFPKFSPYCAYPDEIGYKTGVTTVVDAGSSGSDTINEFYELAKQYKTRILSFLNVSKVGLARIDELSRIEDLQFSSIQRAYCAYPDFIAGLKVRMSASVVGENGIQPLRIAKKYGKELDLPIMVHIGSAPPTIEEVLPYLEQGDIVTHCFHGKSNNHIFSCSYEPIQECLQAGVSFDIGHGTASFSFAIAKQAKERGIPFHTISTDIYNRNKENGPVYNMATTLTKFLYLGYDLETIIQAVTETPAKLLRKEKLGRLERGATADLTLFTVEQDEVLLTDSHGETVTYHQKISPKAVVLGGEYIEL